MGGGHRIRCAEIAKMVEELSSDGDASDPAVAVEVATGGNWRPVSPRYDLVVVDRPRIDRDELCRWSRYGQVAGLDLGGPGRPYCDWLIDTLPRLGRGPRPNVESRDFIALPRHRRRPPTAIASILLSFGSEDRRNLAPQLANALIASAIFSPDSITVAQGPFANYDRLLPPDIATLVSPPNIRELLAGWDLVITSFGLTAYEAAAAGCAVLLLNPSRYHQRLSDMAGFPSLGVARGQIAVRHLRRLARYLKGAPALAERSQIPLSATRRPSAPKYDLPRLLVNLAVASSDAARAAICPLCGPQENRAIARFETESFFRCERCHIIYRVAAAESEICYDRDYFFQDYAAQYGRTYLQDFDHIRRNGHRRLRMIERLARLRLPRRSDSPKPSVALLDIGCAYGPFLAAARERNLTPYGIDIAPSAVKYVEQKLGIPARHSSLLAFNPADAFGQARFEIVTMWYVIEHSVDIAKQLKKIASLLPIGGLFAFSTPNGSGISAIRSLRDYLRASPKDHATVLTPRSVRKILPRFGFRPLAIISTGHHPERFGRFAQIPPLLPIISLISRIFGMGDTFEVYAQKTASLPSEKGS